MIDEYASEVVKRVFTMYAQGIGKQSIAKILNAEGILCPSEYKKAQRRKLQKLQSFRENFLLDVFHD